MTQHITKHLFARCALTHNRDRFAISAENQQEQVLRIVVACSNINAALKTTETAD
jgi:hypothetical protein